MPDQGSAADEHALLQEITAPLAGLPDDAVQITADPEFPVAFRGYDRLAVDAYVNRVTQLVAELQATRSPDAAVRRALERVGEQISGILQRAHETAAQITTQSRREAEDRLVIARREAEQIAAAGEQRVKDLDAETDRIWAERLRIVEDARELAAQLLALAESAAARFPPADETPAEGIPAAGIPAAGIPAEGTPAEGIPAEKPAAEARVKEELDAPQPDKDVPSKTVLFDAEQAQKEASEAETRVQPPRRGRAAEPSEPETDDPDPTAVLPPPPSADRSVPPPTAEHPIPPATAEHPIPPATAEHPIPPATAEHPIPPATAEHPIPRPHPAEPPERPE